MFSIPAAVAVNMKKTQSQFDISYDDDFFVHESETPDSECSHDETCVEPTDMDITSELELTTFFWK
jgi:hypothetical protein